MSGLPAAALESFNLILTLERSVAEKASGATPIEYRYERAEQVRSSPELFTFGSATFRGREYRGFISPGSLETCEEPTSTILIQDKDGIWWKLWFYDKDLLITEPNVEANGEELRRVFLAVLSKHDHGS